MDHFSLHLMRIDLPMLTTIIECEFTHEEKEKTLQKGESMMQNKNHQQQAEYYEKLAEIITEFDDVLNFGLPTQKQSCSTS